MPASVKAKCPTRLIVAVVVLHWRLSYDNRLWKSIFTGGWIYTSGYKVVTHPFLYTVGPKVKPSVNKK
jgi:hypothetical protein